MYPNKKMKPVRNGLSILLSGVHNHQKHIRGDTMLLINFKAYQNGTGHRAVALAKIADKVALETGAEIAVAVDATVINAVSSAVSIPVFAQHVDPAGLGANTGHITADMLREAGARGAIINHTEKKMEFNSLVGAIAKCRITGLKSVVCVNSIEEAKAIMSLHPDYLSLEYADLIGSGKSISLLKPKDVARFAKLVKDSGYTTKPLCGAGVSCGKDIRAALELGTHGVIVASAIVNAQEPERVIREMAEALAVKTIKSMV